MSDYSLNAQSFKKLIINVTLFVSKASEKSHSSILQICKNYNKQFSSGSKVDIHPIDENVKFSFLQKN